MPASAHTITHSVKRTKPQHRSMAHQHGSLFMLKKVNHRGMTSLLREFQRAQCQRVFNRQCTSRDKNHHAPDMTVHHSEVKRRQVCRGPRGHLTAAIQQVSKYFFVSVKGGTMDTTILIGGNSLTILVSKKAQHKHYI